MRDWKVERLRYLVHFADGGSGMRYFDASLDVGAELHDGAQLYEVERVEQPAHENALGHAWVRLTERQR
jgi:hypothetical protein